MPNHVTTRCVVSGPQADLASFIALCFTTKGDERVFDFNTIIPMPACLDGIESGSATDMGMYVLTGRHKFGGYLDYAWVKEKGITTLEQFKAWVEKDHPDAIIAGQRALAAIVECGHPTWYEWCIENWGTKWGAYALREVASEPERYEFLFDTAWSFSMPVFEKLAEMFPLLKFTCDSYDEGGNFAITGYIAGTINALTTVDANDAMYERVYGEAPEREEEETRD